jgi:glucose/arabinose dehydrogenase
MRRALLALLIAGPLGVVFASGGASPVAHALPPGFVDSLVANVNRPTAVEPLADGRVVVLEQHTGRIRLLDPTTGFVQPTPALDLNVCQGGEQGLLGFTDDPDFASSGRVYVYYSIPSGAPGGCQNRVSAFTMSGNTINPGSEQVLVDAISAVNGNHNGGDVEIGNDGFLYISTGDAGRDPRGDSGSGGSNNAAADRSLLNGKILRVNRFTGVAAPGNPFTGGGTADCRLRGNTATTPTSTCREIFAYGLRNPYRFAFDPNTSATRFFINDVGQNAREEVDLGQIGANYGWNACEGACNPPRAGLVDPITQYSHAVGTYVTGGAFIPDGAWPKQYDGGYLFADGGTGKMFLRTATGAVDYNSPFATGAFGLADMAFVMGPAGWELWYTRTGGSVRKIVFPTSPSPADSGPLRYDPLPVMERRFDSREESPPARLRGGRTRLIDVGAPAGATAALVNLTIVRPSGPGSFATAWTPRTTRPATSNVNAPTQEAVANSSIIPLDDDGAMMLFNFTTSHMLVDVAGFFVPAPGAVDDGRFVDLVPGRIVDTRDPAGPGNEYSRVADGQGERITVSVTDKAGLPSSGIGAVVLIATGLNNEGATDGFATLYSSSVTRPAASNLNATVAGENRANLVVVPVSSSGTIEVYLERMDNILLDVAGFFTDDTAAAGTSGRFHLISPKRDADSRVPVGLNRLRGGVVTSPFDPASIPGTASAIAQNLTMARTAAGGFVTAAPGPGIPETSNVNATGPGQVRAALGITKLNGGTEVFRSFADTDFIVDSFGWFE